MHPRTRRNYFSLKSLQLCDVVIVLLVSVLPVFASKSDNLIVRENVSKSNREELARRLRTITGWTDLGFGDDGALRIGNSKTRDGSKSARDLLNKAIADKRVILFEDASSRKDIVFCQVALGRLDREPRAEVYVVLIDFADFRYVTGDKQARAAFDVGWAVLHEIAHVIEDSEDPQEGSVAGDCEEHINRMRRELSLPVRDSYFYSFLPIKSDGNLITRFVRLGFDDSSVSSKRKRYWLIWDAAVVGGLISERESARVSWDIF